MRRVALFAVLFVTVVGARGAGAQDAPADTAGVLVRIELSDGSVFVGTVVREDEQQVVLRTRAGAEVAIPTDKIRRREPFAGRVDGDRVIRFDPNRTRLLFSPTARPLGAGQGYFAVYELFVPFIAGGLTDRVSLAGGTVLLPGAFGRVLYVAPKVTLVDRPRLAVALGGVGLGVALGDDDDVGAWGTAGIGYGLVTYGGPERAVTVGVGFAAVEGEGGSGALVMLGGETQVSNAIKLLTENYVIPYESTTTVCPFGGPCTSTTETEYEVVVSAGIRFFGEQLAADFALWTSPALLDEGAFPFFPWLGFAYNFGR
jgi:hypothetical protein